MMNMWVDWVECAAHNYVPLAWALRAKRIQFGDGLPLCVDERATLALAMLTVRHQTRIIFEHPAQSARMALAAATGLLLADHIARSQGDFGRIPRDLVVVTRQVGLALQDLRDVRIEGVDIYRDIWKVDRASNAQLTSGRGRPRVYVVPPRPGKMFPCAMRAGAVVIDASHPLTLERLVALVDDPVINAAPIQVVILPLAYDVEPGTFDGWLRWVWDHAAISSAKAAWGGDDAQERPSTWQRTLLVCHDDAVNGALERARLKLAAFSRVVRASPPLLLLQAWGVYHRLTHLTVPLGIYEQHALRHHYARPLKEQIEYLAAVRPGDEMKGTIGAMFASEWRLLVESLATAYERLKGGEPAKFWGAATVVEEYAVADFPRPLVITCPTEIEGNILVRELSHVCTNLHRYLHPNGLTVATIRSIAYQAALRERDLMLVGPYPVRWRFLDAATPQARVLVYPHEVIPEQMAVRAVLDQVSRNSAMNARRATLAALGILAMTNKSIDSNERVAEEAASTELAAEFEVIDVTGMPTRRPSVDLSSEVFTTPGWAWDAEDLIFVPPLSMVSVGRSTNSRYTLVDVPGPKFRVLLKGEGPLVVPQGYVFDVYRSVTDEIDEREVERLESGDILILVDESRHMRLFDRIVEALEAHPDYALMGVWLSIWEAVKQAALDAHDGDYTCLYQQLVSAGTTIVEGTVRSWFAGTMGPQDEKNVYRMIDISGDKAAIAHKVEIHSALGHVRGMRRLVGRRIGELVRQIAVAHQPERLLSDTIDLAVEDVLAAARRVVVERVELVEDS